MRKPDFCICENRDADLPRCDREADQRLCFRYMDSAIPLLPKSEIQARFLSDLVRNPEDRFSHNKAHIFLWRTDNGHLSVIINIRKSYFNVKAQL